MNTLSDTMVRFATLPAAFVDRAYGCDRHELEVFVRAVESFPGHTYATPDVPHFVEQYQANARATLDHLITQAGTNRIPAEFLQFQATYGGAMCEPAPGCVLDIFGNGIFAHQFHSALMAEGLAAVWSLKDVPFLPIASLIGSESNGRESRIEFYVSLEEAGGGSVLAVDDLGNRPDLVIQTIVKNKRLPSDHRRISTSYAEWLTLAVGSKGLFGLLR